MSAKGIARWLCAGLLCILALPVLLTAAASQPRLEVRLQNHLTSYASKAGTPFQCIVIRAFHSGTLDIPQGSIVAGVVKKAQSVGLGFRHERAALELSFERVETPDGRTFALDAVLSSIDNAREEVNARGRIRGVLAANNPGNLLNGFWARPSSNLAFRSLIGLTGAANQVWVRYSMGPFGAIGLFAARCALVSFPDPEIHLPPGADFKLTVRSLEPSPASEASVVPDEENTAFADDFASWLEPRLSPTTYANGRPAPDLLNVVLLGSRQQLVSTFRIAGWSQADRRGLRTASRVYTAFSSMRSYDTAPVSPLLYRGALPDLVFEKSLDTVTKRHHVRFWRAGTFHGQEVWLGAATHDKGVTFRLTSFAFTHKIDSDIDVERQKILTDLNFAGCVRSPVLLDALPGAAAGDARVVTDGRILVLATQACHAQPASDVAPPEPRNRATRLTRRVVLETRNYLLRDNAYYWAFRMIRSSRNHTNPLSD